MENIQNDGDLKVSVENNRFVWIVPLFVDILIYLLYVGVFIYSDHNHDYTFIQHMIDASTDGTMFFLILVSIFATWFSGTKLSWKNWLGFGLPSFLLLMSLIIKMVTPVCNEFLCNLTENIIVLILGSFSVLFVLFFAIGLYVRKLKH